jgi:hypothetical protein
MSAAAPWQKLRSDWHPGGPINYPWCNASRQNALVGLFLYLTEHLLVLQLAPWPAAGLVDPKVGL